MAVFIIINLKAESIDKLLIELTRLRMKCINTTVCTTSKNLEAESMVACWTKLTLTNGFLQMNV